MIVIVSILTSMLITCTISSSDIPDHSPIANLCDFSRAETSGPIPPVSVFHNFVLTRNFNLAGMRMSMRAQNVPFHLGWYPMAATCFVSLVAARSTAPQRRLPTAAALMSSSKYNL